MVQLRLWLLLASALNELLALQPNTTNSALTNGTIVKAIDARRQIGSDIEGAHKKKKKGYRSTSSSSASKERKASGASSRGSSSAESLKLSTEFSSSADTDKKKKNKKYELESSEERKGWKKWHRKCHPCPEEMEQKWRDPSIKWICGAYQRARRSFKSLCMMHYRNCQDGTMFVKIHDHRCQDDDERDDGVKHGEHMFYTYHVKLSSSSGSASSEKTSSSGTNTDIYDLGNEFYRV